MINTIIYFVKKLTINNSDDKLIQHDQNFKINIPTIPIFHRIKILQNSKKCELIKYLLKNYITQWLMSYIVLLFFNN